MCSVAITISVAKAKHNKNHCLTKGHLYSRITTKSSTPLCTAPKLSLKIPVKPAEHSNDIELTYMGGINTCVRENHSVL
jgi:hypothetical protein